MSASPAVTMVTQGPRATNATFRGKTLRLSYRLPAVAGTGGRSVPAADSHTAWR